MLVAPPKQARAARPRAPQAPQAARSAAAGGGHLLQLSAVSWSAVFLFELQRSSLSRAKPVIFVKRNNFNLLLHETFGGGIVSPTAPFSSCAASRAKVARGGVDRIVTLGCLRGQRSAGASYIG